MGLSVAEDGNMTDFHRMADSEFQRKPHVFADYIFARMMIQWLKMQEKSV